LTRAPNEVMTFEVEDLDPEVVIPSEPLMHLMSIDKETNTECVFIKMTSGARPKVKMNEAINVKRSKTLGPKDVSEEKQLVEVKLNRSDSDGSMPLYKKLPFQHKIKERRSLRLPTKFNPKPQVSKSEASEAGLIGGLGHRNQDLTKLQLKRHRRLARTKEHVLETPLDLELDLAAQKTKLDLLQSDISRLRDIQCKLQEAQLAGQLDDEERASWLQDHEYLEGLLSKIDELQTKSREERHLEKMIKKTGREIHRLRKAKLGLGELDKHRFHEKLAFLTTSKGDVPPIFEEFPSSCNSRSSTLKHATEPSMMYPHETSAEAILIAAKIKQQSENNEEGGSGSIQLSGDETHSSSSSTCSTPTPHLKREAETETSSSTETERFSYDIDPDIGVIV